MIVSARCTSSSYAMPKTMSTRLVALAEEFVMGEEVTSAFPTMMRRSSGVCRTVAKIWTSWTVPATPPAST